AYRHPPGVGQDVGDDEDALLLENLVGRRGGGAVGAFADDLRFDVGSVLAGDDVLSGGGDQDVAVGHEQLLVRDVLGLGVGGEMPALSNPAQQVGHIEWLGLVDAARFVGPGHDRRAFAGHQGGREGRDV